MHRSFQSRCGVYNGETGGRNWNDATYVTGLLGTGSGTIGVAALGVKSVTQGTKSVSSAATGWTAVGGKK